MNFKWVKGHTQNIGNENADRLANEGAQKTHPDNVNLTVPDNFQLQGIKLSSLIQLLAYKALQSHQSGTTPYTCQTTMNLDITRYAIQGITNEEETDTLIWKHLRHPDIRQPIQQFLYCTMMGSLKIGDFWSNIPTYEHRANCTHCPGETETLEHIMTGCTLTYQSMVWNLVKSLWPNPNTNNLPPHCSSILGCGNITPPMCNDPPHTITTGRCTTEKNTHIRICPPDLGSPM